MRRAALALICLLASVPAHAQIRPIPGASDPRIQSVTFSRDEIVRVVVPASAQTVIELARGESVGTVTLGDPAAWQVSVGKDGASVFIRALRPGATSTMTIRSDLRTYALELETADDIRAAYVLRYYYPSDFTQTSSAPASSSGGAATAIERYRLKGSASLRPQWIADDGMRTYIRWGEEQPLPAVFAVDSTGRELTVDGQMRGQFYTIDRIWPRLVFRIDRLTATAIRQKERRP